MIREGLTEGRMSARLRGNDEALQAVLFDVDGTLADTERDGHRVAFNRAFTESGLDWQWSVATYGKLLAVTGGKERIRHFAAVHAPEWLSRPDSDRAIATLHHLKSEIYTTLVRAGAIRLRPGVARLLHDLRAQGIRLAIATTTTPSSLDSLLLAHFGDEAASLFEVFGAGDVVRHKKPAPDIYCWVLQQMNLSPRACLAVEDSLAGLAAATAAGLPTLITVNAYTANEDFTGALAVVSDLGETGTPARWLGGQALAGEVVDLAQLRLWQRSAHPNIAALPAPSLLHT